MKHKSIIAKLALGCLFAISVCASHVRAADATVALNGDGQFKSVQDAIMAAPQGLPSAERPWVIHVKPGVYKELIYVQRERRFITNFRIRSLEIVRYERQRALTFESENRVKHMARNQRSRIAIARLQPQKL